jgi:capsular exopolysaccharide synthesis family protein
MGAIFGLALGVGMAFLRERLDDRFRGRPDVEQAMEAPVLATVPRFPKERRSRELIVVSEPKGAASEAYRNLRTSLQFLLTQRGAKTLLITSPSEHEGKTATTANLGFALAQAGQNVILVSGDLRRPQLEKYFGVKAEVGLSTYLLGEVDDIGQIVLGDPSLPGLRLLPSGPVPSNPAELLTSPRVGELVAELEAHSDIVIFDAPPVLPVADSVILGSHVGLAVLILDAANTQRSAAVHAKELLQRVGTEVIGCVLNAFDASGSPYYYEPYYYSQYYSKPDEDGRSMDTSSDDIDLGSDQPVERQGSV